MVSLLSNRYPATRGDLTSLSANTLLWQHSDVTGADRGALAVEQRCWRERRPAGWPGAAGAAEGSRHHCPAGGKRAARAAGPAAIPESALSQLHPRPQYEPQLQVNRSTYKQVNIEINTDKKQNIITRCVFSKVKDPSFGRTRPWRLASESRRDSWALQLEQARECASYPLRMRYGGWQSALLLKCVSKHVLLQLKSTHSHSNPFILFHSICKGSWTEESLFMAFGFSSLRSLPWHWESSCVISLPLFVPPAAPLKPYRRAAAWVAPERRRFTASCATPATLSSWTHQKL